MTTEDRIAFVPGAYALIFATINGWLRGFYADATRSIASAIVCVIACANLWTLLRVVNEVAAIKVVTTWKIAVLIVAILVCAVVDLTLVETGRADRWAAQAMSRWKFAADYRSVLCVVLIGASVIGFVWPLFS